MVLRHQITQHVKRQLSKITTKVLTYCSFPSNEKNRCQLRSPCPFNFCISPIPYQSGQVQCHLQFLHISRSLLYQCSVAASTSIPKLNGNRKKIGGRSPQNNNEFTILWFWNSEVCRGLIGLKSRCWQGCFLQALW